MSYTKCVLGGRCPFHKSEFYGEYDLGSISDSCPHGKYDAIYQEVKRENGMIKISMNDTCKNLAHK